MKYVETPTLNELTGKFKFDPDKHFIAVGMSRLRLTTSWELLSQPLSERKRWADALRSGKYKQGYAALYDKLGKAYCCLGVWESINGVSDELLDGRTIPRNLTRRHKLGGIYPEDISLVVQDRRFSHVVMDFLELNDGGEATFEQIAALIHPEGVTDWKALQ